MHPSTPEQQLMLFGARQRMDADLVCRARALMAGPLRWKPLQLEAHRHGVDRLLYTHLKRDLAGAGPDLSLIESLRQTYLATTYRHGHRFMALKEILAAFDREDVEVVLLKGADLAERLYEDSACRPFSDLDLLVRPGDVERARGILLELGYALQPHLYSEKLLRRYHFNLAFVRPGEVGVEAEVHWALTDRFRGVQIDMEGLFKRRVSRSTTWGAVRMPGLEDLVLCLSLHLDMHGYLNAAALELDDPVSFVCHPYSGNRLIWFTDLHEVLTAHGNEIDWDAVVRLAREGNAQGPVGASLALTHRLYGGTLDKGILEALGTPHVSCLTRGVFRRVKSEGETPRDEGRTASFLQAHLFSRKRGVEFRPIRLMDLWAYIFPPREAPGRPRLSFPRYLAHAAGAAGECVGMGVRLAFCMLRRGCGRNLRHAPSNIERPTTGCEEASDLAERN